MIQPINIPNTAPVIPATESANPNVFAQGIVRQNFNPNTVGEVAQRDAQQGANWKPSDGSTPINDKKNKAEAAKGRKGTDQSQSVSEDDINVPFKALRRKERDMDSGVSADGGGDSQEERFISQYEQFKILQEFRVASQKALEEQKESDLFAGVLNNVRPVPNRVYSSSINSSQSFSA